MPSPPLTIYPHRRRLWVVFFLAAMLALLLMAGAALQLWTAPRDGGPMQLSPVRAAALSTTLALSALMALGALRAGMRLRRDGPGLSIEDRGLRLIDRPLLSFAARPVFVPWAEVARLRFTRGARGQRSLEITVKSGRRFRMDAALLKISPARLAEECLARAHKAGFIGTSERHDLFFVDYTEWRLTPA